MSGKINLSGKLQMGNGLIFFGEQTLAQDELRLKMINPGVRPLTSTGKEVKLILGNREYNNWTTAAVAEVNYYFDLPIAYDIWVEEFANMLLSDTNLAAIYDIDTDLDDYTIIIKRKINNARLPTPAYLWQADGSNGPEIEHSDILVRGNSPALTIDYEIVTLAVSGSGYTDGLQPTAQIIIGGSSIMVNLPLPSSTAAEAVEAIYTQITTGSHSSFVNFRTAWLVEKLNATTLRFIAKTTGNKPNSSIDFNFLEETNLAGSFTYLHGY